jgi:putative sigma-54 modulation protein
MQIQVTFRRVESSDAVRDYAIDKVGKLKKFLDGAPEAHVTLSVEKHRHEADVVILANGFKIHGREVTGDLYSAIDLAADKLEVQIKKYRERLKQAGRGVRRGKELPMKVDVFAANSLEQEEPRVIKTKNMVAKPMPVLEAAMQLDLDDGEFFVFINADTEKLNIIYNRKDGDYGLVELEQ